MRGAFGAWRDVLCAGEPALRPVADASLHVTLVFLGLQRSADEVAEALTSSVAGFGPLPLAVEEARGVPPRRPRLVGVSLADPSGRCSALAGALSEALSGFREPEKRPFWPHVTVARVRRGQRLRRDLGPDPPPLRFSCSEVVLYRSHLSSRGARYESLARFQLVANS